MLFRRFTMYGLVLLLAVLPALGMTEESSAAVTSRVAIIQSLTGKVSVKKSGGSKEFRAFARMSLNEGDILTTSANSTAVLQFANGTSADDKMTVSANTTLTFSKLSDRGGTRTKVSMFNGKAWVDVKSIINNNDEFTLETPNAIMGVRGTHLLVTVDPSTGSTRLTVAAGIVSTVTSGGSEVMEVLPGDDALVTKSADNTNEITIAPSDLDFLMQQTDASIIEAIIAAAGDIALENQEKLDEYFEDDETPETELARKKSNVENLLGAIVDKAVQSGLISTERVTELVAEAERQSGVQVDLSNKDIQLTDQERAMQAAQQQQASAASERAAEQQQQWEENSNETHEMLRERAQDKQDQNSSARGIKQTQAEQSYETQLSEDERARFQADKQQLEEEQSGGDQSPELEDSQPSPVIQTPAPKLQDLKLNGSFVSVTDSWSQSTYTFQVDCTTVYAVLSPTVTHAGNYEIEINGQLIESGAESEPIHLFAGFENHISIAIKNKSTGAVLNHYDLYIHREDVEPGVSFDRFEMVDEEGYNLLAEQWNPNLPYEIREVKLFALPVHAGAQVEVYLDGVEITPDEADKAYLLHLDGTVHTIDIWNDEELQRYQVDRRVQAANQDATLEVLETYMLWDGYINLFDWYNQPFDPVQPFYYFPISPSMYSELTIIEAYPAQEGADITVTVDGQEIAYSDDWDGYPIFPNQENIILVTVTAPDGVTQTTYRVMIEILPFPSMPEYVTNWSFTTNENELLNLTAIYEDEFAVRGSEDISSITMQLEFDDDLYRFEVCSGGEWHCEYITSSGQSVTIQAPDFTAIWLDVYEQGDEDWQNYLDGYFVSIVTDDNLNPTIYLDGYNADNYSFSSTAINVGENTHLSSLPMEELDINDSIPVYLRVNAMDKYFDAEQVILNGEPAPYEWGEFELYFREDLDVQEISLQLVDMLGVAEPQWHTVRVYTGDTSSLQLDREQLAVTVNQSVYQDYTESNNKFIFELRELLRPQVASLILVPDEASQDVTFTLYDDFSNLVDVHDIHLPDTYNLFKLLIYREDEWNIVDFEFYLGY